VKLLEAGKRAWAVQDAAAAEANYSSALATAEKLPAPLFHLQVDALRGLSLVHDRRGEHDKAFELDRRRLQIMQQRGTADDFDFGLVLYDLGARNYRLKRHLDALDALNGAVDFFRKCAQMQRRRIKLPPGITQCDRLLAESEAMLGSVYYRRGQYDLAEPLLKRVAGLPDRAVPPAALLAVLRAYAVILRQANQDGAADAVLARAKAVEAAFAAAGQKPPE
jgi:tetratricopeptide (TPR) repeat protein